MNTAPERPAPTTPPPSTATTTPLERIADCADLLARAIRAVVAATPEIPAQVKAEILKGRE
jgi:hypothetical protein